VSWIAKLRRPTLAWGSLLFAAVIVLDGNFLATELLKAARVDLTEDHRFTISEGTYETLSRIDEPIRVNVYFSSLLGQRVPLYAQHFDRVRTLLTQYEEIAGGGLVVEYFDPEPYSRAEDRAVAERVRGVPMNQQGELGYFGISMSNSVDDREAIAFLDLDREQFLEYDLTSRIHKLATHKKPVVGLITGLGIEGTVDPAAGVTQPWRVVSEIRQFFDLRTLVDINEIPSQLAEIPDDVDVLLLVQPLGLSELTIYAIDQYALRGGKIVAFLDPSPLVAAGISYDEKLVPLLARWGIELPRDLVVGDLKNARPSETGDRDARVYSDFVASIAIGAASIDQGDVVAAGVEKLHLMTPGAIRRLPDATTQTTSLISSSDQSMLIDSKKVRSAPDPVTLLREFRPTGEVYTMATRISGPVATSFAGGAPPPPLPPGAREGEGARPEAPKLTHDHLASGSMNAIVVADVDMLNDRHWVQIREFFGEQIPLPFASNAALAVNAIENLSGDTALIALRARGIDDRPFSVVQDLQVAAERRFRETERGLARELEQLEARIKEIEQAAGGTVVLGEEERQMVENFRDRSAEVRAELREVKLALRRDIDRLDETLRVINIAGVPIVFALMGLIVAAWRRRPRVMAGEK
jgi:ABC-type uncharacterized transport system involved in gliding motility auxiliary subunit